MNPEAVIRNYILVEIAEDQRDFWNNNSQQVACSPLVRYNLLMRRGNIEQKVSDLDAKMRAHFAEHEQREDKLDAILEYVRDIPDMKSDIRDLKGRMDNVELKLDVISSVVKEHSLILSDHTKRLEHLDARVERLDARVERLDERVERLENTLGK